MVRTNRFLVDTIVTCEGERTESDPPWGIFGGHEGVNAQTKITTPDGTVEHWPSKFTGRTLTAGSTIEIVVPNSGGYGDPLERDPEMVINDIDTGQVPADVAERIYGVSVDGKGGFDAEATADLRDRLRSERLEAARAPEAMPDRTGPFDVIVDVAEALAVANVDGQPMIVCTRGDGAVLCSLDENYKDHVAQLDTSLPEINPDVYTDASQDTDADVVYRQYICPVTGTLLDNELTIREAPPVWDMKIDAGSLPS
jgi:hypothetical protein